MSPAQDQPPPLADARDRQRATDELGACFAVEAAAGAGKTTVLVSRLLAIIRTGAARLDETVAITFTEKAAGELKVRVRAELEKVLGGELDEATRQRCRQALDDLGHAPIGTIHAFCASLLRERPVEAGVDPRFAVADPLAASLLRERTWDPWLESRLAAGGRPLLRALANGLRLEGQRGSLDALAGDLLRCRDLLEARPPGPQAGEDARAFVAAARPRLADLVDQLDTYCDPGRARDFREKMESARRSLVLAEGMSDVQAEAAVMRLDLRGRFPGKSHWTRAENRDLAKELHDRLKADHEATRAYIGADLAAELAETLAGFVAAYRQALADEGLVDFDDLLLLSRDMLARNRAARAHFKDRCRYLLVDEFQDTDPLQVEIVFFLAERPDRHAESWEEVELEPGKLFVVGDPKQSIYRFRRADIEVYERAKGALCRHGEGLILSQSFRPVPRLAEVVNRIFAGHMRRPAHGAYQPDYVPLEPRREGHPRGPATALLLPPEELRAELENEEAGRRAEARCVAAMVEHMVAGGWTVADPRTGHRRAVGYGDIAILARQYAAADHYADALAAADIPLRIVGGKRFYVAQEVHALVSVLKAVDNPHDRVALVAALRSPFFGISDDALLVATEAAGLLSYLEGEHEGPLAEALAVLRELHERRNEMPIPLLLDRLFQRTKALELFYLRPRGDQRVANLLKIVGRARELAAAERVSLRAFVRWLARLHETQADETESALLEGEGEVQFLTIHRAKGLEFPVVFVADMTYGGARGSNFTVLREKAPSEGQFAFYLGAKDLGIRTANWPGTEYDKLRAEAEATRLFYVATTRARDLLFLLPHWGKLKGGFACLLPGGPDPENPPWGEQTPLGTVFDTRVLDLELKASRPFRLSVPDRPDLPPAAKKRLEARQRWEDERDRLAAQAGEGIAWRTPSRLGHGLVAAHASEEDEGPMVEGRAVGSVVHRCLERAQEGEVGALVAATARQEGLSPQAMERARGLLAAAMGSETMRRARQAESAWHEVPFAVEIDGTVLTGVMDLLFMEGDAAVVVDFKTDAVAGPGDKDRLAAAYRSQVLAYVLAARRALCKPVKEVILCFLAAEEPEWVLRVTDEVLHEAHQAVVAGTPESASCDG